MSALLVERVALLAERRTIAAVEADVQRVAARTGSRGATAPVPPPAERGLDGVAGELAMIARLETTIEALRADAARRS